MNTAETVMHYLYQTTRSITKGINPRLEPSGLYSSEWAVIVALKERTKMTQAELALYMNIEPPAISKSLGQLEKKGWISRLPGERDRREKYVALTEAALAEYPKWEGVVGQHRQEVLQRLSEEEQRQLAKYLQLLFENAELCKERKR